MRGEPREVPIKQGSIIKKCGRVFGQGQKAAKTIRAGLYARVSTLDQQTLPMQSRAMREYEARRGWTIALQVKEVGSGATQRQQREKLLEGCAAPGDRCCAGVAPGSLGKIGHRSARHPAGTGAYRRRVRIADRGTGPDHAGRSRDGWAVGRLRRLEKRETGGR